VKPKKSHVVIATYIRSHPTETWQQIAQYFVVSMGTISRIARESGLSRSMSLDDDANIAKRSALAELYGGKGDK
jgi:hypothetical protein